ncbi:hypothetical protein ACOMHN_013280 [Nucella lapillus]
MESTPINKSTTTSKTTSTTTSKTTTTSSSRFQGSLPLWKRVFVCSGLLALESYITYEEIYLTTTLQRFQVPYALLSLPGAISGGCGTFVVPFLGWLMDRYRGSKRRFAVGTVILLTAGMVILIYTGSISLYYPDPNMDSSNHTLLANNHTVTGSTLSSAVTTGSGGTSTGSVLTLTGGLAIVGFIFGDHGYDTSTLTVRTHILSISPPSQHDSLLLTSSTMGAVGGCMTSLIGFMDLSRLFPEVKGQVIDAGDAQFLVQSIIFIIILFFSFIGTFWADSKLFENENNNFLALFSPTKSGNSYKALQNEEHFTIEDTEDQLILKGSGTSNNNYKTERRNSQCLETTLITDQNVPDVTSHDLSSAHDNPEPVSDLQSDITRKAGSSLKKESTRFLLNRNTKAKMSLMMMVFLTIIAMSCYFFYITNYVAEVIFKGDPHAPAGSDPYEQYVFGSRVGSLSMLAFYVVFVFYNFFHPKILDKIGMRMEFVITSLCVTVLTLILVLTENMVMVFVTMIPLAAYRSCAYTIPFMLANKYAQREHREQAEAKAAAATANNSSNNNSDTDSSTTQLAKKAEEGGEGGEGGGGEGGGGGGGGRSGSALASVTMMIPLTYCLLCLAAGPLIALTDNTALPIYISIGAYGLGTLTAFFVEFDD